MALQKEVIRLGPIGDLEVLAGALQIAQSIERRTQGSLDGGTHRRLSQFIGMIRGTLGQFANGEFLASCALWIEPPEQLLIEELVRGFRDAQSPTCQLTRSFRLLGLALRMLPGRAFRHGERSGDRGAGKECRHAEEHAQGRSLVPTIELRESVESRQLPRRNGLVLEIVPEIGSQLASIRIAPCGLLLEALLNDGLDVTTPARRKPPERKWILELDDASRFAHAQLVDGIGKAPREEFVEHDTQGIDIRGWADVSTPSSNLFGTHVGERADHLPRARHLREICRARVTHMRDAEVDDFRLASFGHQHVARFQIAMHDPQGVSVLYSIANPGHELDQLLDTGPVLFQVDRKRKPIDEFHRDIGLPGIGPCHRLEDLRDTRVL